MLTGEVPPSAGYVYGGESYAYVTIERNLPPNSTWYFVAGAGSPHLTGSSLTHAASLGIEVDVTPLETTLLASQDMWGAANARGGVSVLGERLEAGVQVGALHETSLAGRAYARFVNNAYPPSYSVDSVRGPAYSSDNAHIYEILGGRAGTWRFAADSSAGGNQQTYLFLLDVPESDSDPR